jgi:hypothetical protein
VQGEVTTVSQRLQCPGQKQQSHTDLRDPSPPQEGKEEEVEEELTDRLDELKAEFTQLLSEVRRRRSLLGDPGASPIFEVRTTYFISFLFI